MEPDVSIETGSMIRIAVIPVGVSMPQHILREYVSMLSQYTRIDLASIGSFYSEHQKSPFANQPWESGSLRFKYIVGGAPASPWEDFQAYRKILAVIGVCHCPVSPDLDLVIEQFAEASKTYAFALVKRLFVFSPSEAQNIDRFLTPTVTDVIYCVPFVEIEICMVFFRAS
ncbi:hypothetical protein HPP92_024544 [Vanilla planifolia]|uniref:Trs120/TRAPPC9 N-terminal domain-containing protein n=2 Tax=Vanilla planifolia TaxID=51239 RepID=A0A835PMK7_VANPL|nr:hypothetical protein HPP92_024452 [Vanilla planifolia]KAG0456756.1 hypothetical protein HPP92_024544 [Vanilla planifolia]